MTPEETRDLFISDIKAIRTERALKTWGKRWAPEIKATGYVEEIRAAYLERMEKLTQQRRAWYAIGA